MGANQPPPRKKTQSTAPTTASGNTESTPICFGKSGTSIQCSSPVAKAPVMEGRRAQSSRQPGHRERLWRRLGLQGKSVPEEPQEAEPEFTSPAPAENFSNNTSPLPTRPSSSSVLPPADAASTIADLASDDAIQLQSTKFKGLWKEAHEKFLRDQEGKKLLEVYQTAILEDGDDQDQNSVGHRLQAIVKGRLEEIEESRAHFTLAGKTIVIKDQVRRAIDLVISAQGIVTSAVSSEPHAALAWAGVLVLMGPISKAMTQDEEAADGFEFITRLLNRYGVVEHNWSDLFSEAKRSKQATELNDLSRSIKSQIVDMYAKTLEFQIRLAWHYSRSGFFRALKNLADPGDWRVMHEALKKLNDDISQDLKVMGDHVLLQIDRYMATLQEKMDESQKKIMDKLDGMKHDVETTKFLALFKQLHVSDNAKFDSAKVQSKPQCFDGTQENVLAAIDTWISSPKRDHIFWLPGMVGTGKSTISRTVAKRYLGASFFFDRHEGQSSSVGNLFPTICTSLADALPELESEIYKAVENNPEISNRPLHDQWELLISEPVRKLEGQNRLLPLTLVVVIDALDECKPRHANEGISSILTQIAKAQDLKVIRLKFFLTGRPESHIESSFKRVLSDSYETIESPLRKRPLNTIQLSSDKNDPDDDITRYVRSRLTEITRRYDFEAGWPGEIRLKQFVGKTGGLWIYASIACDYLGGLPQEYEQLVDGRLQDVLQEGNDQSEHPFYHDSDDYSDLDRMYGLILQNSLAGIKRPKEKDFIISVFQRTVGTITVLCEPLPVTTLSRLLSLKKSEIDSILISLGSVINMGDDNIPVRFAHLSFTDYLTSETRCSIQGFQVNKAEKHAYLLESCLTVLSGEIRQDVCCLKDFSTLRKTIDAEKIKAHLTSHVQYACLHWVEHLQSSNNPPSDDGAVHVFLKTHLLHWLEALSILGRISDGVRSILTLSEYLKDLPSNGRSSLQCFVRDMMRFVLNFRPLIEKAPLQIYRSALLYCPEQSLVRKQYKGVVSEWTALQAVEKDWSPLLQTLQDKSSYGRHLAFSPDNKLVASSTGFVWDTTTGTLLHALDMRGYRECEVMFPSKKGNTIMILSKNGNVRVWDLSSGLLIKDTKGPERMHRSLRAKLSTFSPSGTLSADLELDFLSGSQTVTLLDIEQGQVIKKFEPHERNSEENEVGHFTFSPDSKLLATLTDHTVRIWSTATGALKHDFGPSLKELGAKRVACVAFSRNGELIAVVVAGAVYIYGLGKSQMLHSIIGQHIYHIMFSPADDSLVSLGSTADQFLISWWDLSSKEPLKTTEYESPRIGFSSQKVHVSPGENLFTITSNRGDTRINIWDFSSRRLIKALDGHTKPAVSVSVSGNGSLLASGSNDNTICLWDLSQSANMPTEPYHSEKVKELHLSPNQRHMAVIEKDGGVSLWDLETLKSEKIKQSKMIVFSPDGRLLANLVGPAIEMWDMDGVYTKRRLEIKGIEMTWRPAFSANNELFAYGYQRQFDDMRYFSQINILSAGTGQLCHVLEPLGSGLPHYGNIGHSLPHLVFSPNDRFLAAVIKIKSLDSRLLRFMKRVSIWSLSDLDIDLKPTSPSRTLEFGVDSEFLGFQIAHIAWSLCETKLAAVCDNGVILLWDVTNGNLIRRFGEGSLYGAEAITFSPDGNFLASASFITPAYPLKGGKTLLWEAETGSLIGSRPIGASEYSLRFSPDGRTIVTGMGRVDVRSFSLSDSDRRWIHDEDLDLPPGREHDSQLDLAVQNDWILFGREKAFLLPHSHQVKCAVATNDLMVLGHESGRLSFLQGNFDEYSGQQDMKANIVERG